MDPVTHKPRGFGYVTYADPESVESVLDKYKENKVDGKWVEVKRCIPQDKMDPPGRDGRGGNSRSGGGNLGTRKDERRDRHRGHDRRDRSRERDRPRMGDPPPPPPP